MRVISTRGGLDGPRVSLSEALSEGLAPDGGLYVPEELPLADSARVEQAGDAARNPDPVASLAEVAEVVLEPFFRGDPLADALPELCREAFSFPAPMQELAAPMREPRDEGEGASGMLELFHGPTAAFKDYAARFLAAALERIPAKGERHVLVATSGDTGSAVAAAFHGRPRVRVTVLYPEEGVSPRQAHLLGCFGGNVQSFRVQGSFDECQRMVKVALGDPALRTRHGLTSANSISLGRLLPQMAYYVHAALRRGDVPSFIIPSGNFGNALACLWAREVGYPIGDVFLATNRNRALVEWLETGKVESRESVRTPANAMDVGVPSNLERLRFRHPEPGPLRDGSGTRSGARLEAGSVTDQEIRAALAEAPKRWGVTVCPHTACALHHLGRLRDGGDHRTWIVVATAHPAKFPEVVEPEVGHAVELPPALAELLERPARAQEMEVGKGTLARVLG